MQPPGGSRSGYAGGLTPPGCLTTGGRRGECRLSRNMVPMESANSFFTWGAMTTAGSSPARPTPSGRTPAGALAASALKAGGGEVPPKIGTAGRGLMLSRYAEQHTYKS